MKLQVKVIVAKFSSQAEVDTFYEQQLDSHKHLMFVSFQVIDRDGAFYATISFTEMYAAAEWILSHKTYTELTSIAKENNIKLTKVKDSKVPVNRRDIERQIAKGEITNAFVSNKINLGYLFEKGKSDYRLRVFKEKGIDFYKTVKKKCLANKNELLQEIMMCANTKEYAFEVALFIY